MSQLTASEALALSHDLASEVVARESVRRADSYDPSSYVWQSDDRVGNTLSEIVEIRAYGYPLPKGAGDAMGYLGYKGFQYEGLDGFLKGSHPHDNPQPSTQESFDPYNYLYLAPLATQEETMISGGKEEVVHTRHGRGFILDSSEAGVKVYFMQLPGETPSCPHGANIKWVKRENLL